MAQQRLYQVAYYQSEFASAINVDSRDQISIVGTYASVADANRRAREWSDGVSEALSQRASETGTHSDGRAWYHWERFRRKGPNFYVCVEIKYPDNMASPRPAGGSVARSPVLDSDRSLQLSFKGSHAKYELINYIMRSDALRTEMMQSIAQNEDSRDAALKRLMETPCGIAALVKKAFATNGYDDLVATLAKTPEGSTALFKRVNPVKVTDALLESHLGPMMLAAELTSMRGGAELLAEKVIEANLDQTVDRLLECEDGVDLVADKALESDWEATVERLLWNDDGPTLVTDKVVEQGWNEAFEKLMEMDDSLELVTEELIGDDWDRAFEKVVEMDDNLDFIRDKLVEDDWDRAFEKVVEMDENLDLIRDKLIEDDWDRAFEKVGEMDGGLELVTDKLVENDWDSAIRDIMQFDDSLSLVAQEIVRIDRQGAVAQLLDNKYGANALADQVFDSVIDNAKGAQQLAKAVMEQEGGCKNLTNRMLANKGTAKILIDCIIGCEIGHQQGSIQLSQNPAGRGPLLNAAVKQLMVQHRDELMEQARTDIKRQLVADAGEMQQLQQQAREEAEAEFTEQIRDDLKRAAREGAVREFVDNQLNAAERHDLRQTIAAVVSGSSGACASTSGAAGPAGIRKSQRSKK